MRCLKSILGIRWWHKVTHVETRHRAADIDTAEYMLVQRQIRWIGHVIRMPSNRLPPTPSLGGITQWTADAGRPKITLHGPHSSFMINSNILISDFEKQLAADRDTWLQRYMEKCLRQWSEHTLSGVKSSSCRSTLPQAPPAHLNSNWSQMSAMQPSVCFRVWPTQLPS